MGDWPLRSDRRKGTDIRACQGPGSLPGRSTDERAAARALADDPSEERRLNERLPKNLVDLAARRVPANCSTTGRSMGLNVNPGLCGRDVN